MIWIQIICWAVLIAFAVPVFIFLRRGEYGNVMVYLFAVAVFNFAGGPLIPSVALIVILVLACKAFFGKKK